MVSGKRLGAQQMLGLVSLVLGLGGIQGVGAKGTENTKAAIPDFVKKHAPLVWTHSQDPYQPSDILAQVTHTIPKIDHKDVKDVPSPLDLNNLNKLNDLGGESVYLTSKEGIVALPSWFKGVRPNKDRKTEGAVPATVVVRDHGDGTVDAFYFYFSAYNEGNTVIGIQFGNHVGDWEHNMIRFKDGKPEGIWYSQHSSGHAFTWDAVDKEGDRPYAFSSNGSHAVYATEGTHDHTIPGVDLPIGILKDECDKGSLWDPLLSAYFFSYNTDKKTFTPYDDDTPVNWLYFNGKWGDLQLPDDDPAQIELFGQRKYTSGPNGPAFKALDRKKICPSDKCWVRPFLTEVESEEDLKGISDGERV